jgi:hypothetical protein
LTGDYSKEGARVDELDENILVFGSDDDDDEDDDDDHVLAVVAM